MGSSISRRHGVTGDGSPTSQPTMGYAGSDVNYIYVSKDDLARWRPPPSRSGTPPPLSKAQHLLPSTPSLPTANRTKPSSLTDRMTWTREDGKPGSSTDNAIEISDGDDDDDEPSLKFGAGIQVVDDSDEENIFDDTKKPKTKHEAGSEETAETMSWTRTSGPGSAGNAICVSDSTDSDNSSEADVGCPPTPSKRSKPTRTTVVKQEASQFNPSLSTNLRYDSVGNVATPKQEPSGTQPVPKIQIPAKPAATPNPEAKTVAAAGGRAFNRELGEHVKDEPGALDTPPQTPTKKLHDQARPPVSKFKGKQRAKAEDEHLYPSLVGLSTPSKPTPGRTGPSTSGRQAGTPKKEESDDDYFSIPGAWSTPRWEEVKPEKILLKSKLEEERGERVEREINPLPTPESTPVRSKGRTAARGVGPQSKVKAKPNVDEYLRSPAPTPVSKKKGKCGSVPPVPTPPDHKDTPKVESPSIRTPKRRKEDAYFSLSKDFFPYLNPSSSVIGWVEIDGVNRFHLILPNGECLSWYQSLDAWRIFIGMAERYIKRLCGGRLKEEVEAGSQGFALCYAMGMGKTHVVVAVHYMLHIYMQEVAKVLGASVLPVKKNLIVAPVGMHQHWKDHITRITGGAITVEVYNRTGKHSSGLSDSSAHVIITNPETLVNDRKRFKENRATIEKLVSDAVAHGNPKTPDDLREMFTKQSDERCLPRDAPLGVTTWGVVIIDEFHDGCLANAENLASRAVLSLNADGFGLLSGTPAQNSVNGDLQAPLQLLSTHRSKRKDISLVEEECAKAGKKVGIKDVVKRLDVCSEESQALLQATFITRHVVNPVTGKQVIELPLKSVYYVHVELNDLERRAYDTICDMVTCVLVKFTRGRLACDNTSVALKLMANTINRGQDFEGEPVQADSGNNDAPRSVVRHCPRPQNLPTNEDIWDAVAAATPEPDQFQDKVQDRVLSGLARKASVEECVLGDRFVSSKFAAVSIIAEQLPVGEKMIVFSMFTSVLDEVGNFLEKEGYGVVKCAPPSMCLPARCGPDRIPANDGRMNSKARDTALHTISDDPLKRIILVSLKAGGVGLNITACNHIILLDPWWNPYVEDQAIARAWRIGQTKEVHVYHLVCPETVEDRILEVQRRKKVEVEAFLEGLAVVTHEGDHDTPNVTMTSRV